MINDKEMAKKISDLMLEYGKKLDESISNVKASCSTEEFESYKKAIGKIMGYMLIEVMNPLYKNHPELKPKELN